MNIITWLGPLVCAVVVARFGVAAFSPRWGAARDRLGLVSAGGAALLILVIARALVDWSTVGTVVWPALVIVTAVAVGGSALRWPVLPWLADPAKKGRRYTDAGLTLGVLGAVLALVGV